MSTQIPKAIIISAILALTLVSIVTTEEGVRLIWGSSLTSGSLSWIPWCLAAAVGALMFGVSLLLPNLSGNRLHLGVLAYLFAALPSVFFNVHFVYSLLTHDEQLGAYKSTLIGAHNTYLASSIDFLSGEATRLRAEVAQAQAEAEIERTRLDRPGTGPLWIQENIEYREMATQMPFKVERFESALERLTQFEPAGAATVPALERGYADLVAAMAPFGIEPQTSPDELRMRFPHPGTLENSLLGIIQGLQTVQSVPELATADALATNRALLALVLGAMIDLLNLLVVFVLRPSFQAQTARRPNRQLEPDPWMSTKHARFAMR